MQVLKGPCKFIETEMTGVDPTIKKSIVQALYKSEQRKKLFL